MKRIIICGAWLLALASACIGAQAQQKYIIKGKIEGLKMPVKLMLFYSPAPNKSLEDSVIVKDGTFQMQGTVAHPFYVTIRLKPIGSSATAKSSQISWLYLRPRSFYLTGGLTTIEGADPHDAIIRNPVQDEYMEFITALKPFEKPLEVIDSTISKTNNVDSAKVLKEKRREILKQRAKGTTDFVKAHPSSYVSFDLVKSKAIAITDGKMFEELFNSLAPSFRNSPDGKRIVQDLSIAKKLAIGSSAMPFTQTDSAGKPVSLSDLKGKYVLIDFWASWCGWCSVEYPYMQKGYALYKNKNFEIIGVSLDDNRERWVNAIKKNKFPWLQVCDLKGRNNSVAKIYGVSAIPRNFLIDPNGVIVAKDLRGEELTEKLNEIFKDQH